MGTCLAAIKIRNDTARESRTHGAEEGNSCRHYGDHLGEKRDGVFRHACLNVGNFTAANEDSTKTSDLCEIMRKFDTDVVSISEHGLNLKKLNPSQSWESGLRGQFQ